MLEVRAIFTRNVLQFIQDCCKNYMLFLPGMSYSLFKIAVRITCYFYQECLIVCLRCLLEVHAFIQQECLQVKR